MTCSSGPLTCSRNLCPSSFQTLPDSMTTGCAGGISAPLLNQGINTAFSCISDDIDEPPVVVRNTAKTNRFIGFTAVE